MWKWIVELLYGKPKPPEQILEHPHNGIRRKMDTNTIRARIQGLGWKLLELPVKKNHPDPALRTVSRWKVVATRGENSCEVSGTTIDEAIKNIGMTLGAIARE